VNRKVPLSVLDLVPITSGSTAAEALRNSVDLSRQAERLGYARYWFAEHHLNAGVAGVSPAVVIALVASATSSIRIGSGGVQLGHRTALSVVEEFGLLDAVYPGRLDLGLGRSAGRPRRRSGAGPDGPEGTPRVAQTAAGGGVSPAVAQAAAAGAAPNGLRIPQRFPIERLLRSPRIAVQRRLLQQPNAESPDYGEQIGEILALLRGEYRSDEGLEAHAVPGEDAAVEIWILGSSGGESAEVAGRNSLRFAANYHVSPATVLEAAEGYRAAFRPSPELPEPYIAVSADAVVAEDEETARELATGYGLWVYSIRGGAGAIPFPSPAEARDHNWTEEERALVADRVDTQFVGSPRQVADQLRQLQEATGADELVVTTITHEHADRVRSYELLAREWSAR
jgi:alkanesulfonate monooxygenase SsuD/methylene tetrahydromethanopterin reductase-like flavin-dependent oxidoreductase (luciferase family)